MQQLMSQKLAYLDANIQALSKLIDQYNIYKEPEDLKEIDSKIISVIDIIKSGLINAEQLDSKKFESLKAIFEGLVNKFASRAHLQPTSLEETKRDKDSFYEKFKLVEFDPNEEKKEELMALREVKDIKLALKELLEIVNTHIANQDYLINGIQTTSERTVAKTGAALKNVKKAVQAKRESKLSITKWVGTAVGWLFGGPIGVFSVGVGAHYAEEKINAAHDKRLDEIEKL